MIREVRHHKKEKKPTVITISLSMKKDCHKYHHRRCINLNKSFFQLNSSNVLILTDFTFGRKQYTTKLKFYKNWIYNLHNLWQVIQAISGIAVIVHYAHRNKPECFQDPYHSQFLRGKTSRFRWTRKLCTEENSPHKMKFPHFCLIKMTLSKQVCTPIKNIKSRKGINIRFDFSKT